MKIHELSLEECFKSLCSRPEGLEPSEAQRRLLEFGPNEIPVGSPGSLVRRFLKSYTHLLALILWGASGLAFLVHQWEPSQGMATLGFAILGVVLVNGLFSFWQEYRAERAIAALRDLLPRKVNLLRAGHALQSDASQIVPGDVIQLSAGEQIPADCRLITAFGVRVNNATITGESLPHSRDTAPCLDASSLQNRNLLLAGTWMISGEASALVFATGAHTEFGKIAALTQTATEPMTPLQNEIAHLSRVIAWISLALAGVFFGIGEMLGLPRWQNLVFAIGILVANVPEGLLPTVTLALAMGSQRMAGRNALIRHLPAVETLGSTTVICTDKTGTLTENALIVREIFIEGEFTPHLPDPTTHLRFLECARNCHNLRETKGKTLLGDPTEIALVEMAKAALVPPSEYPRVDEIPFDSQRKRLSTLHRVHGGHRLFTKGAPESVLPLCTAVESQSGPQPLTPDKRREIVEAQQILTRKGLRVLALASRSLESVAPGDNMEKDLIFSGLAGLEDPPRPEVPEAIRRCKTAGIKVIMVTGDHPETALMLAQQIGLVGSGTATTLTGSELERLSPAQLQLALDAPELIFARVAPEQKMQIVDVLKRKGHIVAVTGDGVNDAPALKHAHIGIAMGGTGTDVARESSDMILLDDNFASIVGAIEEGRAIFSNVRKFLTYVLTSNVPEFVPYLGFALFKLPLALTILQILAVDLGTDILPALALGAEKAEPGLMERPPRRLSERLLDWPLIFRAYLFLGPIEAMAAMSAFFFTLLRGGWQPGAPLQTWDLLYRQATASCLAAIVCLQMVAVFLCRSERTSVFGAAPGRSPMLFLGVLVEAVFLALIVYSPWGQALFFTGPVPAATWVLILPFALFMWSAEEVRKWWVRIQR
jgi:sodium/potassium-transporting ATPase subunit alpha